MLDAGPEETTCPICLQAYQQADKAAISSCLHAFCIGCLQAWCRHNRSKATCPLCKRHITGYLYNIRSDADYQEHSFEHEAAEALLLEQQQLEWAAARQQLHLSQQQQRQQQQQLATIQQADRQQLHAGGQLSRQQQQPRIQLRSEAGYSWGDPVEWRRDVLAGSSSRSRQRQGGVDAAAAATGGEAGQREGSTADGVAPRPYYWRVQQRMLAS
ncbi:hypothetical protein OEZ85_011257 [Tetradesmus obliquus]|uniref:RING-type E3 ubiquitin transferase n=1 Tax=Tetradesmus obliquus TaxID=3088 RepID=A0ABY8TPR4_TETOB|nr:hypothetical protein OEZ85_011257 [Tetradesmus obliquus]